MFRCVSYLLASAATLLAVNLPATYDSTMKVKDNLPAPSGWSIVGSVAGNEEVELVVGLRPREFSKLEARLYASKSGIPHSFYSDSFRNRLADFTQCTKSLIHRMPDTASI